MPVYVYRCSKCKKEKEVVHSIKEIDEPTEELINGITCHGRQMIRVPQLTNLQSGKPDRELLADKQKEEKRKARLATAQQVEANDKDIQAQDRPYLRNKYKKTKGLKGNPFNKN
jgi:tRNA A37 threonylcarbamoyladenosine modification protein TsaB